MIHVEQSNADLVEDDVETVSEGQRPLACLTELRQRHILQNNVKMLRESCQVKSNQIKIRNSCRKPI